MNTQETIEDNDTVTEENEIEAMFHVHNSAAMKHLIQKNKRRNRRTRNLKG